MKKLYSLLLLAACVFCMTACASNNSYNEDDYKSVIEADLQKLSELKDAEIIAHLAQEGEEAPETDVYLYTKWMELRPIVGDYEGILEWKFSSNNKSVTVTATVDYALRDAKYVICYLMDGSVDSITFNAIYTFEEQMQMAVEKLPQAGLNTVIGMGVVFIVLILISLIIGCFKYINMFEQSLKNKKESKKPVAVEAVDNTIAQIVKKEEEAQEELVDDLELVAVIAAAIAAHTGTSTDGFVVRSIKKSNRKKWLNA